MRHDSKGCVVPMLEQDGRPLPVVGELVILT